MKYSIVAMGLGMMLTAFTFGQKAISTNEQEQEIRILIDTYSQARTDKDSILLKGLLTGDIDQLVSSGNWRKGKKEAMKGMLQSSTSNPGRRTLKIEQIRFLNSVSAITDARYEIRNADGTTRKMWSTFIVLYLDDTWKITAIRNMLPTRPQ